MSQILANGLAVLDGSIVVPAVGAWTADLRVDTAQSLAGAVTVAIDGGLTLKGTAFRTGVWLETGYVRIVAGAGGLGKPAKAKHYRSTQLSVILRDLLGAGGETLAASSDAALLRTSFPAYTQLAQPIGSAISALLQDRRLAAPRWRALADGTIWVGKEAWPDAGLVSPDDYQEIAELPHEGRAEIGIEAPRVMAGQALEGRKVSAVEYLITDGSMRMLPLFET